MRKLFTSVAMGFCLLFAASQVNAATPVTLSSPFNINSGTTYEITLPSSGDINIHIDGSYANYQIGNGWVYILFSNENCTEDYGIKPSSSDSADDESSCDFVFNGLNAGSYYFNVSDLSISDQYNGTSCTVTFEGGDAVEPYEIVSMTPAEGTLKVSTEAGSTIDFTVTLNREFTYGNEGMPPYWQLVNPSNNETVLSLRYFVENNTAEGNLLTCEPVPYSTYTEQFTNGAQLQFQMSLDGQTMLNGYTWTVELVSGSTDPGTGDGGNDNTEPNGTLSGNYTGAQLVGGEPGQTIPYTATWSAELNENKTLTFEYTVDPVVVGLVVKLYKDSQYVGDFTTTRAGETFYYTTQDTYTEGEQESFGIEMAYAGGSVSAQPISFVVPAENAGGSDEGNDVDASPITPEVPFDITSENNVFSYETTDAVDNFYFVIEDNYFDLFEDSGFGEYLALSKNENGSDAIKLTYIEGDNDQGIYTGTNLEANTTYYLVLLNAEPPVSASYNVTLYLEAYAQEEVSEITLKEPFTISSTNTTYVYNNAAEGDYYLVSNSDTNLLSGGLQILYNNSNIFATYMDVATVNGEEGLVYTGLYLQRGDTYTFQYTGSEEIELTLMPGTYATSEMDGATMTSASVLNSEYPVIELTWNEKVYINENEDEEFIVVYKNNEPIGSLEINSVYVQLLAAGENEPGIETRAEAGDAGSVLNILLGATDIYTQQGGAGNYTVYIPKGMVINEDGLISPAQQFSFQVVDYAVGTCNQDGTNFELGENVTLMISFEGAVEAVEDTEGAPIVVTNYNDIDETYTWDDSDVVEIVGEDIVITLGNELTKGTYELGLREGVVTVDGVPNAAMTIMFTVGDDSEGISGLNAVDGNAVIYNLQGVKVQNPTKGLYIINGKKVIIK